jgi:hypothetical protein
MQSYSNPIRQEMGAEQKKTGVGKASGGCCPPTENNCSAHRPQFSSGINEQVSGH